MRQYLLITLNYWAFTLTDGALRMLVVLYFHQLGYNPIEIVTLFLFYEIFGIVTNALGGYWGARFGLNATMNVGLFLQIIALTMLMVPDSWLTIIWVMAAQAISGIAKDLNKMSAKSAIKIVLPDAQGKRLYRWVAILTGSKNTLKGCGFFLGGVLLSVYGFKGAIFNMAIGLGIIWLLSLILLDNAIGKTKTSPKLKQLFSQSSDINGLSAARLFLFASRDIWFVVALPIYLSQTLGWQHHTVGAFFALWVIVYGFMQSLAPTLMRHQHQQHAVKHLYIAAIALLIVITALAGAQQSAIPPQYALLPGLFIFAAVFAVNSALHSYLIVQFAGHERVALDVGFYYMANAAGRLLGTVLSGLLAYYYGLSAAIWGACLLVLIACLFTHRLVRQHQ